MEIDFDDLVDKVFKQSPKPEKSYAISLDSDLKDLFTMLLHFLTNGLKILYGDSEGKVDIVSINNNPQRLIEIDRYMKSIGIIVNLDKYTELQWVHRQAVNPFIQFNKKLITATTQLKELEYCIIKEVKENNSITKYYFLVSFDILH